MFAADQAWDFEGLELDPSARALHGRRGEEIMLRRSEYELLLAFITHPGRALNRDFLLQAVARRRSEPYDRSIDVLVGRLRRKIELDLKRPRLILPSPGWVIGLPSSLIQDICRLTAGRRYAVLSRSLPMIGVNRSSCCHSRTGAPIQRRTALPPA